MLGKINNPSTLVPKHVQGNSEDGGAACRRVCEALARKIGECAEEEGGEIAGKDDAAVCLFRWDK